MPKICYINWNPAPDSLATVHTANQIIEEYLAKGFDLTLRQLYYQFVARDLIPNTMKAYNRIKGIMNKARLAGLVDWNAITDRTRNVESNSHWTNPGSIIRSAAYSFMVDHWEEQPNRVEVWIEKDALKGVIEGICERLDVPYFSCRGYTSVSEMWRAGNRLIANRKAGQTTWVIHLGDHDPSGIDMSRDIEERLELFTGNTVRINRIALNMNQIEELDLPPNPAKLSDSRAQGYIASFGSDSWELDALDPEYMSNLIEGVVKKLRDPEIYARTREREGAMKTKLDELAEEHGHDNW
jgi:hypothetical protein